MVSKKFKWTDEDGNTIEVTFGTDGENVDINGEKLNTILDGIREKISNIKFDVDGGIAVGNGADTTYDNIAIGSNVDGRNFGGSGAVIIGAGASGSEFGTAIGSGADSGRLHSIAIGSRAVSTGYNSCQIGQGTNNNDFTAKIYDYQLTSSDGGTMGDTKQYLTDVGKLADLKTYEKTNISSAINEIYDYVYSEDIYMNRLHKNI